MATSLHISGVQAFHSTFSKTSFSFQPLGTQQRLDFAVPLVSVPALRATLKVPSESRDLRISCQGGNANILELCETENQGFEELANQLTCVMKFGGSSVASAERMREVADLICSFPEERPVIVLSAMGKTTNNLLLVLFLFLCFCV